MYDSINIKYKPRQTVSAATSQSVTLGVESTDGKGTRVRVWGPANVPFLCLGAGNMGEFTL